MINVAAMPSLRGEHSDLTQEVRRYTREGLERALDRAGFRATRVTYTNAATLPLVATVRALQRRGPPAQTLRLCIRCNKSAQLCCTKRDASTRPPRQRPV